MTAAQPLIQLDHVTKDYGHFRALNDVSVRIAAGITGLLGPNGAGKSTLIKVMLGLVKVSAGSGHIFGFPLGSNYTRIRAQVGYVPEDDCYISGLSGVEMVRFAARLSGIPSVEALRRAHEMLDFCGMEQERYRPVETYSTGMRQKLKFAQAIVHDPPLLILDEPTSGLDPQERQIMLARIRGLAENAAKTVLISTHILPDVRTICDDVIIMARGEVLMAQPLSVLSQPKDPSYELQLIGEPLNKDLFLQKVERAGLRGKWLPDGALTVCGIGERDIQQIWAWARQAGVGLRMLRPARNSLEQIFVDVVQESPHAGS